MKTDLYIWGTSLNIRSAVSEFGGILTAHFDIDVVLPFVETLFHLPLVVFAVFISFLSDLLCFLQEFVQVFVPARSEGGVWNTQADHEWGFVVPSVHQVMGGGVSTFAPNRVKGGFYARYEF